MPWYVRVALGLVACSAAAPAASGQEPPAGPRAKVEFRWLESKPVKGVTEETGIKTTCGDALSYPHATPILTVADVAGAVASSQEFRNRAVPAVYHGVTFRLTERARARLVEACGDRPAKVLAVFVDGQYRGAGNFEAADPADFAPFAGYFETKAEAERIVDACRPAA